MFTIEFPDDRTISVRLPAKVEEARKKLEEYFRESLVRPLSKYRLNALEEQANFAKQLRGEID